MNARPAACAALLVTVLCAVASPAAAKSGVEVSVAVNPGGSTLTVSASGGDDAAGPQRLCVQQATATGWRTIACGRTGFGTGGTVRVQVPATATRPRVRAVIQRMGRDRRRLSGR